MLITNQIEIDPNRIEIDQNLVCPILTLVYRDGDSDEIVRTKASNALKMRAFVTACVAGLLAFSTAIDAEEVYECSKAVFCSYLGLVTFLTVCLVRDALCVWPMLKSSNPRRLVDVFTRCQLRLDGAVLGIGLPASVIVLYHDRSGTGCRAVAPTLEWTVTVAFTTLFLSVYYVILVAMAISFTAGLLSQLCTKVR